MGNGIVPSFILTNINRLITQSGRTKLAFLRDQAELNKSMFVAVTETWLSDKVFDSGVSHNFQGYTIMRSDRTGRSGGGVAIYLRDDLSGDVISTFDNGVCEALVIRIHQLDHVVVVVYRPPDTRHAEFSAVLDEIDKVLCTLRALSLIHI